MKYSLNATTLKVIALILMFIDHYVAVMMSHNDVFSFSLRVFGRIAAPVFCFFIAEGYHYTSNKINYIKRLLIFAVIAHIPYILMFEYTFFQATSIMWGLALGLIALTVIKSDKYHIIIKALVLFLACGLSITANWNYVAVLWIVAFGVFRDNFKWRIISFLSIGIVFHLIPTYINFGPSHEGYPHWYQLGIILAVPLLIMYNGEPGKNSKLVSKFMYVFYPGHMLLIYLLKQFIS